MPYSYFVGVAIAIHLLTSINMFIKKDNIVAIKPYRWLLISIMVFYITDFLWGIFESYKLQYALYIDTFIYFIAMGATIMFWTNFVIKYLDGNKIFSQVVRAVGIAFFLAEIILLVINIFVPILFNVDSNCVYSAHPARDIMLWTQIGMYSLIIIYSAIFTFVTKVKTYRRYIAIILFCAVMITCIAIQLSDPYIPFYSIGCLVGVCIVDTYALTDSRETIKEALQETKAIAYTDSLTGVKSRHAFVEKCEEIDNAINTNNQYDFAVAVFDLNGLKAINDKYGHAAGDEYIIKSIDIISSCFPKDSLYRYGGDEFVAILEGEDIEKAPEYHQALIKIVNKNLYNGKPVISSGIARFDPHNDNAAKGAMYRADIMMYERKASLKNK